MPHDFTTQTACLALLEEATAEWSPRARKCARNMVTDCFLLMSPQDSNKTLEMLLESLAEYRGNRVPLPSKLESRFKRLAKKPRWKVAQTLFYGPYNEPVKGHKKIWSQYTTLTERFQRDVDMLLGGFQLIAIWRYLGVPVYEESLEMLFNDFNFGVKGYSDHANIQSLAKESSKQVWTECERAHANRENSVRAVPMTEHAVKKLAKAILAVLESMSDDDSGIVDLFFETLGYGKWESVEPTVMVGEMRNNPVVEEVLEWGDFELAEKMKKLGKALYLTELHVPGLAERAMTEELLAD